MMFSPEEHGRWARERFERQLETAALLRQRQQPSQSLRQAVGLRFIQIGARLAAEPSLESVRSR
jgi:hypothetical protein